MNMIYAKSRRSKKSGIIRAVGALLFCQSIFPAQLAANSAPERLSDPARVDLFYSITARVNCQCSCHDLLGECPHLDEDCFGVQTRRFIETRILEGMDEPAILAGFVSGFGERVRADRQLRFLAARGRQDLVEGYVRGFGPTIVHTPPSALAPVLIVLTILAIFAALVVFKLYRLRPPSLKETGSSGDPAGDLESRVRKSIDRLER